MVAQPHQKSCAQQASAWAAPMLATATATVMVTLKATATLMVVMLAPALTVLRVPAAECRVQHAAAALLHAMAQLQLL